MPSQVYPEKQRGEMGRDQIREAREGGTRESEGPKGEQAGGDEAGTRKVKASGQGKQTSLDPD